MTSWIDYLFGVGHGLVLGMLLASGLISYWRRKGSK